MGGQSRNFIARVTAGGAVDPGFSASVNASVYCAVAQPDGKVVIGGAFTTVGGDSHASLARLNPDGTVDRSFNPSANNIVRCIVNQTDGKLIVAGDFTSVNGAVRNYLARLHPDGTLDESFNPNADAVVFGAALQEDGKVLAGGQFESMGGRVRRHIVRLDNEPATQSLVFPEAGKVQWLRGGSSPETHLVTFESSGDGGGTWSVAVPGTRIPGGWEVQGITLPSGGRVRARARTTGGYGNGSSGLLETVGSIPYSPGNCGVSPTLARRPTAGVPRTMLTPNRMVWRIWRSMALVWTLICPMPTDYRSGSGMRICWCSPLHVRPELPG